MNKVSDF